MNWKSFLTVTDRYPLEVQVKNGWVQWNPQVIFVTAVIPPEEAWLHITEERQQLTRRITETVHLTDGDKYGGDEVELNWHRQP